MRIQVKDKNPVYIIIFILFAVVFILPFVYTLGSALFSEDFTHNLKQLFNSNTILLLGKSILLASLIALLSTLFGSILAFLLYKTQSSFSSFFKIALLIPLFISPYILAVAWKDFFFLFFQNTQLISSYFGLVLVLLTIYTPLSILIIGSALSNIHSSLEETGFMISTFWKVIFKIVFPLIKPALMSSFVLVFIFSISEFSVPAFFGIKVFTTEIFTQFSAFYHHSLAVLQSLLLIIICILLLFSERKYIANAPFLSIGGKGKNTKIYALKNGRHIGFGFLLFWFAISILLPFFVLIMQSSKGGFRYLSQAFNLLAPSFSTSISLSFIAAFFIVIIGFIAAYSAERKQKKSFDWMLLILFAIPSTIFGISLIKFYNHPMLNFIYSSYAIIIIGYIGKFSFIASKLIANSLKQIPNSLDEAAQIEGITFIRRLWKILIPILSPALFISFMIAFIFSLGELGITIMVYPPGTEIMPIKVFTIMANAPQALTSSMTLIVFSLTLLLTSSFYFIMKFFFKNSVYEHH